MVQAGWAALFDKDEVVVHAPVGRKGCICISYRDLPAVIGLLESARDSPQMLDWARRSLAKRGQPHD